MRWAGDILTATGQSPNFPLIGDPDLRIAKLFRMLPEDAAGASASRTATDNATARTLFIIGPDKKINRLPHQERGPCLARAMLAPCLCATE